MTKSVFSYRNGFLCAEAVPLVEVVQEVDTPFFCTSTKQLQRNYSYLASLFANTYTTLHYAVRANGNIAVLRVLAEAGAGADVATTGELERALGAGFLPKTILFTGEAKTQDDIVAALIAGVIHIQAGSLSELHLIGKVAAIMGIRANVSLMINSDEIIEPYARNGFDVEQLGGALSEILNQHKLLSFDGISVGVFSGRQGDGARLPNRAHEIGLLLEMLAAQGIPVGRLTLGCGDDGYWDADKAPYELFVRELQEKMAALKGSLSLCMGRRLVASASALVARIRGIRESDGQKVLLIDVSKRDVSHTLPDGLSYEIIALCDGKHGLDRRPVAIKGPSYELDDMFGKAFLMPDMAEGDLVAIMNVGAYGSSMSFCSSGRSLLSEGLVSGAQFAIVRRHVAVSEQLQWETIPEWMGISCAA